MSKRKPDHGMAGELADRIRARRREIAKYERLYADFPGYRMGGGRRRVLWEAFLAESSEKTWLDVGCGRGETWMMAESRGIKWSGCDAVDTADYVDPCVLPDLPYQDRSYDLVTCLDVMEHLPDFDWKATVRSIGRVARERIVFCVCNEADKAGALIGETLHITRLPYREIGDRLQRWLPAWEGRRRDLSSDAAWWEFVK